MNASRFRFLKKFSITEIVNEVIKCFHSFFFNWNQHSKGNLYSFIYILCNFAKFPIFQFVNIDLILFTFLYSLSIRDSLLLTFFLLDKRLHTIGKFLYKNHFIYILYKFSINRTKSVVLHSFHFFIFLFFKSSFFF